MPIHPDLLQFVGLPYQVDQSPRIDSVSDAVNCQLTIHKAYLARLGIILPKGMWSQEIYEDEFLIFNTVAQFSFEGDIGIFGPAQATDPRCFHLAYFTGQTNEHNDPLLIHATAYDQQVSIWPLSVFFTRPRYEELKRIKRVKPAIFNTHVRPTIYAA